ncbi:unnamed protein product, partial [Allacma fusca]
MSKVAAELVSEAADLSFQAKEDSSTRSRSTTKSKITKRLGIENVKVSYLCSVFSSQLNSEVNISDKPNYELPEAIESGAEMLVIHPLTETDTMGTEVATDENDNLIRKLRLKRISRLKDDLARFEPEEDDKVDIGEGNFVSKNLLAELKMEHRHNPGVFLRKLMERSGIFSLEGIANSSLTGQKHHDGLQRPRLDFKMFSV